VGIRKREGVIMLLHEWLGIDDKRCARIFTKLYKSLTRPMYNHERLQELLRECKTMEEGILAGFTLGCSVAVLDILDRGVPSAVTEGQIVLHYATLADTDEETCQRHIIRCFERERWFSEEQEFRRGERRRFV